MAPYWYWRALKNAWPMDESATNRFDLPEQGALSGLAIHISTLTELPLYNYVDAFPVERTSMRIVGNGNFDIINAAGKQLHAMNFIDSGIMPQENLTGVDGEYMDQYLYLNFGRYLGDPKYGLWLDKFAAGVQFEETNTFSTTYYVDGYTKYTIYGLFRKNPEASLFSGGFLRKRQILNKNAASETQYGVRLPTENKLRQIHLFSVPACTSGAMTTTWWNEMLRIWLSIKSREEYIMENELSYDHMRFIYDYLQRKADTFVRAQAYSSGPYMDTMIDEKHTAALTGMYPATAHYVCSDTATDTTRYQRYYAFDSSGTSYNTPLVGIRSSGLMLHGNLPLLTQKPDTDETEWLDAKLNKDVYVEVTENVSTGTWQIVLDELEKMYPS